MSGRARAASGAWIAMHPAERDSRPSRAWDAATGLSEPGCSPGPAARPARLLARPGYSPSPARVLEKLVTPFFSVTKYNQLPAAGCSAASIAALPGLSIGPGGSPLCR